MASSAPSARHLVLVGMMGTGKTTVGHLVARRLRRPFVDSDNQVLARTGRTVAQIWETEGEAAFRRLEAEALAAALASEVPAVLAAAGGVVKDPANRRRLKEAGTVVWLRARPATLEPRVKRSSHRPLLTHDALGVLTRLDAERAELYQEVADTVIDIDDHTPGEVADMIVALAP
jgi:shikimate kinase